MENATGSHAPYKEWSSLHNDVFTVYCLNVQADSSDSKDIDADDDAAD